MSAIPRTPSLADRFEGNSSTDGFNHILEGRNFKWDLGLPVNSIESPKQRQLKCKSEEEECVNKIVARIRFLYWKDNAGLLDALETFDAQAHKLYGGWVLKVNADRGVLPDKTRHRPRPITSDERRELREKLLKVLNAKYEITASRSCQGSSSRAYTPIRSTGETPKPDDSPLAFPLSSARKNDGKHRLEPFPNIDPSIKKAKGPSIKSSGHEGPSNHPLSRWNVSKPRFTDTFQYKTVPLKGDGNSNGDISFTTNASTIFSQGCSSTLVNTQATEPEPEPIMKLRIEPHSLDDQGPKTQSSDFDSSFDGIEVERMCQVTESSGANMSSQAGPQYDMADDMIDDTEDEIANEIFNETMNGTNQGETENCLNEVLPMLPHCLQKAPFFVSYEITRVFLFVEVSMAEFTLPYTKEWEQYDKLWNMLKTLPVLQNKKFPERCGANVWEVAMRGYIRGFNGVVFTAALLENKKESGPLFSFRLKPMRLDLTHRLERRFGSDRFFEIAIPDLEGRRTGSALAKVDPDAWNALKSWLVNGDHQLFARTYKSYFVKCGERKRKSTLKSDSEEDSSALPYRAFLFATDGHGFIKESRKRIPAPNVPVRMTVEELLNSIRPTSENDYQPYMKLFARTALVVSRNRATVTIEEAQIRRKEDIRNPDVNDPSKTYVMTDGAGRMSLALARKIVLKLELSYIPSAFQGRFGEAKGLWIVDRTQDIESDWIELYGEQCKWKRGKKGSQNFDHPSHRTFEVVGHSAPLKTADLNTQLLPILMHQATNSKRMENAIVGALKEGLNQSLEELRSALNSPQELRCWNRLTNSALQDRVKNGTLQWLGGLPAKNEDKLSVLLDAGFDPRRLQFVMDLVKKAFDMKCAELKERLNITVAKSTKVYMVPDFWGVLEPNEVHLDFSSFVDNETGLSDTQLENMDVLVARNPAHYPSDIQRVTAVNKHELRHLKDVIVFSTKGYPALADKLSGGDYDGDIAWVCWDRAIVESFANADVPKVPDLVKEGYIEQNKTTYAQLTKGSSDPTNRFLNASFDFNMCQSLLGQCTAWKENIEYKIGGDLNRQEITFLATLLSNLVDQGKQGYIFTEKHFQKVKRHIRKSAGAPHTPAYKVKNPSERQKPTDHVLDKMTKVVEEQTDKFLDELRKSISPAPPQYDSTLAQLYKDQRVKAKARTGENIALEEIEMATEWNLLLDQLDEDIARVKNKWNGSFRRTPSKRFNSDDDESRPDFAPIRDSCFEDFCDIKPLPSSKLIPAWPDQDTESESGTWALLRASALYATYEPRKKYSDRISTFPWWMAGLQLASIKSKQNEQVPMAGCMYAMLKANTGFVKQLRGYEGMGMGMGSDVEMGSLDEEEIKSVFESESEFDVDDDDGFFHEF
ncbi:putative rna-dependent rna polymerase protein [Botrytis fragariae]|uniref:RNA-dependent RNA polymerase n=1 Tax=Botrytis fragariae TaxID=1964551 RepID=A0A8H6B1U9_9HELO|nr:putative rna-dependent rna polymerase protein [Botrytis fragariae]KAF5877600.1 putative rna-dependent rna polymerase protein [Botrytis fragariae]